MKFYLKQVYLITGYIVKIFTVFRFFKFEINVVLMTFSGKFSEWVFFNLQRLSIKLKLTPTKLLTSIYVFISVTNILDEYVTLMFLDILKNY